jgi:hypothetical protein
MPNRRFLLLAAAVTLPALACGPVAATGGDEASIIATRVAGTLAALLTDTPEATVSPLPPPVATPLPARLWKAYISGGPTGWWLEDGTASEITLPVEPGQYYDYSAANRKILYASHFASSGAGPGNLAVSDLWMVDYPSGTPEALIPSDTVVEAMWAPNGVGLAYILATPATYELRYRSLAGDDRLLASNISPTWSVSPSGSLVAFTRETGYDVPGAPGLFVVSIAGGPETQVSDADRHGAGSIEDQPEWSYDDGHLALSNWGFAPGELVIAASDGSSSGPVVAEESLSVDPILGSAPTVAIWHPDGRHLVGFANYAETMGGPSPLVLYELDDTLHTITGGVVLANGYSLVGWNVPGESIFIVDESNQVVLIPLP